MRYSEAELLLKRAGIENAAYDAAEIFCRLGGVSRASLRFEKDRDVDDDRLTEAVRRRCEREPLQYILGEWDFFGLTFEMNENCLCPRPDTEVLVEQTLLRLPRGARMLELCTGSGCIPISVCHSREDVSAISTDIFPETLALAERNAVRNGVVDRISFRLSDVFSPEGLDADGLFDAIVSNPPYIRSDVIETLMPEVRDHDPCMALDGTADGLYFYRRIIEESEHYLKRGGQLFFEIGHDQAEEVSALMQSHGYKEIEEGLCRARQSRDRYFFRRKIRCLTNWKI